MSSEPPSGAPSNIFERVEQILMGNMIIPHQHRTPEMERVFNALIERLVDTDEGTGLPSAARAMNELRLINESRKGARNIGREPEPCTVIFLDLNAFKNYNTVLGHQSTDLLIKAFAHELSQAVRHAGSIHIETGDHHARANPHSMDLVARYKRRGDEFVIIMPGSTQEQAEKRMENILQTIASKTFFIESKKKMVTNLRFTWGCYELDSDLRTGQTHDEPFMALDKANDELLARRAAMKTPDGKSYKSAEFLPRIFDIDTNEHRNLLNVIHVRENPRLTGTSRDSGENFIGGAGI